MRMAGDGVDTNVPKNDEEVQKEHVLKGKKMSWGKLRRIDSLDAEACKVSGMQSHGHKVLTWSVILKLAFQSIGIVYGDIGTSPLYVYASTFPDGIHHRDDLLGVLSLIVYTITLITFIKYILIVLWANDNGDGGTFALYSLICRHAKVSLVPNQQPEDREISGYKLDLPSKQLERASKIRERLEGSKAAKTVLLIVTLLGTAMVIGDGVLTPCISVLSAVSGIKQAASSLSQDAIVGISIVILIGLFLVQRFGTDKVGYSFAPAIFIWFSFIGIIGIYNFFKYDTSVIRAFYPKYIYDYFRRNKRQGWISLGGVVLAITGTEAMFADLGHFSVRSIQIGFASLVYPALLCAYTGQAAYLRKYPDHVEDTFYKSIPDPIYWPMFVVAVAASIIASQAMISGAFSIVAQSLALGCFPRVKVVHTSSKYDGQVYIPEINHLLMILCVIVTASFRETTKIGNAYGIAVVAVMVLTTSLVTLIMLMIWKTNIVLVVIFFVVFGSIEFIYLSSVLYKFKQGGYLPLAFAVVLMFIMYIWHYVHTKRYIYEMENKVSAEYMRELAFNPEVSRVPGIGLMYSELVQGIPPIFSHFITNFPAIHSVLIFVSIKKLPVSRVLPEERFIFRRIEPREYRMYRCIARYGYKDAQAGVEEFENILLECLKEFIRSEHLFQTLGDADQIATQSQNLGMFKPPSLPNVWTTVGESAHDLELVSKPRHSTGSGHSERPIPINPRISSGSIASDKGTSNRSLSGPLHSLEQELQFIEKAKNTGIVYLLGQSEFTARKDSSIFKMFVVDYAYNFLRRNFRQGNEVLEIPKQRLLQVGMHYEI